MKNITIILPDLRGGGAERLHIYLANEWVSSGFSVDFVLLRNQCDLLKLLKPEITVTSMNVSRIRESILPLAKYLRKTQPDVVLTAMWPLTSAVVLSWLISGRVGKLFISEHENLTSSYIRQQRCNSIYLKSLIRLTYLWATGIIAVSHGVKKDLCALGNLPENKVKVIYNPAATGVSSMRESLEVQVKLWGNSTKLRILSVGRLALQKDHQTLINAFALIQKKYNLKLIILGDGPLRSELLALVSQLGLEKSVSLPGFSTNPYPWFRSANLFVLSSRWEGFGNVIVEALECGLPVVSTDCPSGPAEILEDGRYGRLVRVQDPVGLAAAMEQSLNEVHDHESLMRRAQDFSVKKISDMYLANMSPKCGYDG